MIDGARRAGLRHRLRRLSLYRGRQSAEEPAAALGAGGRVEAMLARLASPRRAHASAPRSSATGSTIGAASRPGTACRSRSRPTCRSTPARPSPRSRQARGRDPIDLALRLSDRGQRRDPRAGHLDRRRGHRARSCARPPLWSAPTATASRPTAQSARACHTRGSTAPFRASSAIMCGGAVLPLEQRDPQDDRRDRAGAQAARPRAASGRLSRRHHDLRSGGFPRPRDLRRPAPVSERRPNHVIVNGAVVVENATHTGRLPGKVLRRDQTGAVW